MTDTRPHFWFQIIENISSENKILCAENLKNDVSYYYGIYDYEIHTILNVDFEEYDDNFYIAPSSAEYVYDDASFFVIEENEYGEIMSIINRIGAYDLESILDDEPDLQYQISNIFNYSDGEGYIGEYTPPTGSWNINDKEVQSLHINNKEVQTITRVSDGAILYQALRDYVVINDVTKYYYGSERFFVTCYENNEPAEGKIIEINFNNRLYHRTTNEYGQVSIPLNQDPGTYEVTTIIDEQTYTNTVTILSTIVAEDVEKYYGDNTPLSATFLDTTGQPLSNSSVRLNINGEFYDATTNSNGIASFDDIDQLDADEHIGTFQNIPTGEQKAIHVDIKTTIISEDLTKYFRCSQQFEPVFLDTEGNYITDTSQNAQFLINGRQYDRPIGSTTPGVAKLSINLNPDVYNVTTTNPVTGESVTNTITVLTVLLANDLVMKYKDGSKFIATLLDCDGRPYAGQTVEFNVNGVFYNRVTDSSGQAKWNVGLMAGEYIITSSYNNLRISNTITVTA